ncbi:putative Kinase [Melia azedarach]|uniref:Kinase n=1 Tax=Melia azedarach TaxID=155640 RepID=A0ACC1YMK4_MELAZ|nr:putative Kinase [Melia azedarach]
MIVRTDCTLLFILLLLWPTTIAAAATGLNAKPNCPEKCGEVSVPYPFGIGENCALNNHFNLVCNHSSSSPKLLLGTNIFVLEISVENGTILASIPTANRCYDGLGGIVNSTDIGYDVGDGPFRFSDTKNKLTAFGCDTLVFMSDANESFYSGCLSLCTAETNSVNTTENFCSGIGCCQTPLPKSLKTLSISLDSYYNHTKIRNFKPCDYAILADETFDISSLKLQPGSEQEEFIYSNATIEWVVNEERCETSRNSADYACGNNTHCNYSENGQGYRCLCNHGFQGNPYLGCYDIDECKDPKYKCEGSCKNTFGNYTCRCPFGMYGDGKIDCRGFRITTIVIVVVAIIFTVIVGVLMFITCKQRRKERNFLRNGGTILKHQRVRIFSEAELDKATKNYDKSRFLGEGGFGSVYRGVLSDDNNTQVAVKKPKEVDNMLQIDQEFEHELGIVFQVNHRNVVKILGLCLQTKVPLLVYEFVPNGTLSHLIHDKSSQVLKTWKNCLRVGAEIALALDYFHSLASPTIIHGDVKPSNILLDGNYTAKVADFGASVLLSRDKTVMVTKIQGTFGYLDPEYLMTGILTEKSDVYSYGVVLIELLTGLRPGSRIASNNNERVNIVQYFLSSIEDNNLSQILSFEVADEREMKEVEIVAELAAKCVSSNGVKRPKMKEVAEELERIKKLHEDSLRAQEHGAENVLGERELSLNSNLEYHSAAMIDQSDNQTVISFNSASYHSM